MPPSPTYKVFHSYKTLASSFEKSEQLLGILQPGRYRGFDTKTVWGSSLPGFIGFGITHTASGIAKVDSLGNPETASGIVLMPQGTVIHTNSTISIQVADNSANAFERLDYVVIEHQWAAIIGGTTPTLSVIKGANGGPVLPAIPNPTIQIPIGTIKISANGSAYADIVYTPIVSPPLANYVIDILAVHGATLDTRYARLKHANTLENVNTFMHTLTVHQDGALFNNYGFEQNRLTYLTYANVNAAGLLELEPEYGNNISLDLGGNNTIIRGFCTGGGASFWNIGTIITISLINNVGATAALGGFIAFNSHGFSKLYRNSRLLQGDVIVIRYLGEFYGKGLFEVVSWPRIMESNYQDILLRAAIAQPAWVAVSYDNTFETAIGLPLQYRKNTLGQIELRGAFKHMSTTPLSATKIGTLPVGYRPDRLYAFTANYLAVNNIIFVEVDTDGAIYCSDFGVGYSPGNGILIPGNFQMTSA